MILGNEFDKALADTYDNFFSPSNPPSPTPPSGGYPQVIAPTANDVNFSPDLSNFLSQYAPNQAITTNNQQIGGAGSGMSSFDRIYDTLAQSTRDLFGEVKSTDFTAQIQDLAEQGRLDIESLSNEQLDFLETSYDRRMGQINEIGADLLSEMRIIDTAGAEALDQISADATDRTNARRDFVATELNKSRQALGEQVSSEFEEIAALTTGLQANTAESNRASLDRLRAVSQMASQERLAMPAKLVAQAQLAVGDEKFRLENQIKQSTSDALRQLNATERQQVLAEAQRLAAEGYAMDMALAQSLQQIESQRANMYIEEEKARRARAAAAAAAQAKAAKEQQNNEAAAALLGISATEYALMDESVRGKLWDDLYLTSDEIADIEGNQQDELNDRLWGQRYGIDDINVINSLSASEKATIEQEWAATANPPDLNSVAGVQLMFPELSATDSQVAIDYAAREDAVQRAVQADRVAGRQDDDPSDATKKVQDELNSWKLDAGLAKVTGTDNTGKAIVEQTELGRNVGTVYSAINQASPLTAPMSYGGFASIEGGPTAFTDYGGFATNTETGVQNWGAAYRDPVSVPTASPTMNTAQSQIAYIQQLLEQMLAGQQ